ncbi:circadian locomoter output cycles protein kaput isoform X2 [Aricia agestis]|uniref:circadian locomoter output cycles protein kaput isoform X2 n=1 Tax=Aricia agestis TaxID=91739 RepID=UPI001C2076F2|nr:circadian locomoter output cycles protein kaput isoform X2 [Aricia agestis]
MDDDGDDKDDTKRRTRNLSEKKRRDQFNMLVNELGSMISSSNRRMDKSTVLKSTISFLKNHNEVTIRSRVHDVQEDWKPTFLSNEEFTYLMLEALEGFIMVLAPDGTIHYVSESITSLLGHSSNDIIQTNLFDLTYQDDRSNLYNILQNNTTAADSTVTQSAENEIRFQCHLRRGTLDFRDNVNYELVEFNGHFRMLQYVEQTDNEEHSGYQREQESRLLFVCTGRLHTPHLIRDVSLVDLNRSEFTSRHSLEWKFLFLDHRAPPIIGYLPFEVLGTSGYDYYHFDDLEKVVTCHEALMQKGELTSCYYRFLTKGQQWIWLQTRFYITYHQWNAKPEFVVCTHRVVSYADIAKSTKQESGDSEQVTEAEQNDDICETPGSEHVLDTVSSSYMTENSETFGDSYQTLSQPSSVKSTSGSTTGTPTASGSAAWSRVTSQVCYSESDRASMSSESRSSHRTNTRDECRSGYQSKLEPILVPLHGIGTQYLQPAPYVGTVCVPAAPPLAPLPPLSVMTHDQTQIQLQRKHEELQQMIVRQQEELRQVKEQLLLARLGILQPVINVPNSYGNLEEVPPNQRIPPQILYEEAPSRNITYAQQMPPNNGNNQHNPNMPR